MRCVVRKCIGAGLSWCDVFEFCLSFVLVLTSGVILIYYYILYVYYYISYILSYTILFLFLFSSPLLFLPPLSLSPLPMLSSPHLPIISPIPIFLFSSSQPSSSSSSLFSLLIQSIRVGSSLCLFIFSSDLGSRI